MYQTNTPTIHSFLVSWHNQLAYLLINSSYGLSVTNKFHRIHCHYQVYLYLLRSSQGLSRFSFIKFCCKKKLENACAIFCCRFGDLYIYTLYFECGASSVSTLTTIKNEGNTFPLSYYYIAPSLPYQLQ